MSRPSCPSLATDGISSSVEAREALSPTVLISGRRGWAAKSGSSASLHDHACLYTLELEARLADPAPSQTVECLAVMAFCENGFSWSRSEAKSQTAATLPITSGFTPCRIARIETPTSKKYPAQHPGGQNTSV
jgi:hypothetical protein